MQVLIAIALLAQVLGPGSATQLLAPGRGYVSDRSELVLASGRYALVLGQGCDAVVANTNVEFLMFAGSATDGAINPIGTDDLCFVSVGGRVSEQQCAVNADQVCDAAAEVANPGGE